MAVLAGVSKNGLNVHEPPSLRETQAKPVGTSWVLLGSTGPQVACAELRSGEKSLPNPVVESAVLRLAGGIAGDAIQPDEPRRAT